MAIPFPERLLQSWLHKRLREIRLRFSWGGALTVAFALVSALGTLYLTIALLPPAQKRAGWLLFAALTVLALLNVVAIVREGTSTERLRREMMCALLRLLHERVFHNSPHFRLTLFIRDPVALARVRKGNGDWVSEPILVPFLRRQAGQNDYGASGTRVYYPLSSTAATAKAWNMATRARQDLRTGAFGGYLIQLEQFASRHQLEDYYQRVLGVSPEVTRRLSEYMVGVVQILSFPLVDNDGDPMFLLSVDSYQNFWNDEDGTAIARGSGAVSIDKGILVGYLEGVRQLLIKLRHPRP